MLSKYVYGLSLGRFVVDFSQGALAALVFAMNLVSSIIQPLFGFLSDRVHTG